MPPTTLVSLGLYFVSSSNFYHAYFVSLGEYCGRASQTILVSCAQNDLSRRAEVLLLRSPFPSSTQLHMHEDAVRAALLSRFI
jgi:hypothetical protein